MLLIDKTKEKTKKKKKRKTIPKELIYEMRNGKPIYYRDYDKVVSGEKTLEEVTGSSYLQWLLIQIILKFLFIKLDKKNLLLLQMKQDINGHQKLGEILIFLFLIKKYY